MIYVRLFIFILGMVTLSFGISMTIHVQYLGIHPWDVLSVALYDKLGLSIGSWGIIIGLGLTTISFLIDRSYVRLGTFINIVVVGICIDFFLWLDFLPKPSHFLLDSLVMTTGIVIMGIGGGLYNSVGLGAGPRDGFMLSISDKTGYSIRTVRMVTETTVLLIGLLIGGPVFIFSFLFTFIQSPVFQYSYEKLRSFLSFVEKTYFSKEKSRMSSYD